MDNSFSVLAKQHRSEYLAFCIALTMLLVLSRTVTVGWSSSFSHLFSISADCLTSASTLEHAGLGTFASVNLLTSVQWGWRESHHSHQCSLCQLWNWTMGHQQLLFSPLLPQCPLFMDTISMMYLLLGRTYLGSSIFESLVNPSCCTIEKAGNQSQSFLWFADGYDALKHR